MKTDPHVERLIQSWPYGNGDCLELYIRLPFTGWEAEMAPLAELVKRRPDSFAGSRYVVRTCEDFSVLDVVNTADEAVRSIARMCGVSAWHLDRNYVFRTLLIAESDVAIAARKKVPGPSRMVRLVARVSYWGALALIAAAYHALKRPPNPRQAAALVLESAKNASAKFEADIMKRRYTAASDDDRKSAQEPLHDA